MHKLDAYLPDRDGFTLIVDFHGGGMENGDKTNVRAFAEGFVKAGYGVVAPNYRKYPQGAKYPDFLVDAAHAVAFAKSKAKEWGGNGKIVVSGHSAGAWLTAMLCLNKTFLEETGISPREIDGWIVDSAQTTDHYNVMKYEDGADPRLQRIGRFAPLYYVDGNTDVGHMLLFFYENDMPCRPEQNMLFYKAVLAFDKEADIAYEKLAGRHCEMVREPDGAFSYVVKSLEWLKERSL